MFDWDGTAVPDRRADASALKDVVEALCAEGVDVGIVSGTHLENIDGQLAARPGGPGRLHLLLNRGSEVFEVLERGPVLRLRRSASASEEASLNQAAALTVDALRRRGLKCEVVGARLNRRKIDLIPVAAWADPPKARISQLLAAIEERLRRHGLDGLPEVVEIAAGAARAAGLQDVRISSDAKHVEIGLTDKADSARWFLRDLSSRGVGPRLLLIAGDEFGPLGGVHGSDSRMLIPAASRAVAVSVGAEPGGLPRRVVALGGGPAAFLAILQDQLRRHREGELPEFDADAAWTLAADGLDPLSEPRLEALFSLAGGVIGTVGIPVVADAAARPLVLAAGVYRGSGSQQDLLHAPVWNAVNAERSGDTLRRVLDMRAGMLWQTAGTGPTRTRAVSLVSLSQPGVVCLKVDCPWGAVPRSTPLLAPRPHEAVARGVIEGRAWMVAEDAGRGVAVIASESRDDRRRTRLERIAVYAAGPDHVPEPLASLPMLIRAESEGVDGLMVRQRASWAARWADADIELEGDQQLQRQVRFALFQLMASVADRGEAAVGARGLAGSAYRAHVFWDTDVFVLPFLAATNPASARAILEYRLRRLQPALDAARRAGRSGARFPWESAATGDDVTPHSATDRAGRRVPILTGQLEEHIVADVAWAASTYAEWSGDDAFLHGPGRPLLVETARYWASRIEQDPDGGGHIRGVIGPDEYHEAVNDNAFTNVMARWNLHRAAELVLTPAQGPLVRADVREAEKWRRLADSLVDGYQVSSGLYEQFDGFFGLEPLLIRDISPRRPIAADLLLGSGRVERAQVLKQADALMLHLLVPGEVSPGSLEPNLDFYEPRTAHGSSLSPGVHAALMARAGRLEDATRMMALTARIDLDDVTSSTAGGLHLAAMGSLWMALVMGFGGIRPCGQTLLVDPRLPHGIKRMRINLRFREARVAVVVRGDRLLVEADQPTMVRVGTLPPVRIDGRGRFEGGVSGWRAAS